MRWPGSLASRWRQLALIGLSLLALAGVAKAGALDPLVSGPVLASATDPAGGAYQEPITPIPPPPPLDPRKLALGERLFADRRLSGDGTLACASCHAMRANGADGRKLSLAHGGSTPRFNTPTIFNAALNFRFDWEGDVRSLEAQVEASLRRPESMAANADVVLRRLRADPAMVQQFRAAYGREPDHASLVDAIATYERALVTPGGRFDRWLGGDAAAITVEERNGYRLFKSLGCVSCHQGVNVGGNLYERRGVFRPLTRSGPAFLRVPSLRNVATTQPYFHDGSAATLEQAVRRMAAAQLNQRLSDSQVEAITAFLRTLTGTYRGAPVTAVSR